MWISIHNTLLKEAPEGQGGIEKQEPWRKNGFKQKTEDYFDQECYEAIQNLSSLPAPLKYEREGQSDKLEN